MDWAKAKTVMIAAFLVINIFFSYMIFTAGNGSTSHVDSEKVKMIVDYLAGENIVVEGKVPLKKVDMPLITVKYRFFGKEDIKAFFDLDEIVTESVSGGTMTLGGKARKISIKDSRELNYTDSSIGPSGDINENTCAGNIKEFLNKIGIRDYAGIKRVEDMEGYKKFTYLQSFKGAAIYNGIIEIYSNNSGIKSAKIVWFEEARQTGKRMGVISPAVSLLYLPEHNKKAGMPIKRVFDISQGYYFSTGAMNQVDIAKVEEGTAFPVWKITTDRGIVYINAYNEKLEGVE